MTLFDTIGYLPVFILVLIVWIAVYWSWLRATHLWKLKGIPCEDPFPLIGNDIGLFQGKTIFLQDLEWYQKHGRLFGVYSGSLPILFVSDPEIVKKVLVKDFHLLCDRRQFESPDPLLNNFVSALNGEEWRRVRSIITPGFSSGKLKKMISLILDCCESTKKNFLKYADNNKAVDCKKMFGSYTLDVIASTAFGTKLNSHQDPDNVFVRYATKIFGLEFSWSLLVAWLCPRLALWLNISPISREATSFFRDLSLGIMERRKKTNEVRNDFLSGMMEAQKNSAEHLNTARSKSSSSQKLHESIDEEEEEVGQEDDDNRSYFKEYARSKSISSSELVSQCVLFFLAGYDTTATTLSFVTYYLALNPEHQKRVIQEVDEISRKYPFIDAAALNEMIYTDAVISETLRLSPPATRLERLVLEDYTINDVGLTVPKGALIGVPIYGMHRDPEFFPNPDTFDPERFLPENKDLLQPYTYLPFGTGPRNCLGMKFALMEIKLGLLQVYKDFTFEPCSDTLVPMQYLRGTMLLQPKSVKLKVTKRRHD